jgi:hypothetical protein
MTGRREIFALNAWNHGSATLVVSHEIRRLRLEIGEDLFDGGAEGSGLCGSISGFDGDRHSKQHTHTFFLLQGRDHEYRRVRRVVKEEVCRMHRRLAAIRVRCFPPMPR